MIGVFFTKSSAIGSWMIRELTGEDCSHCAVYLPAENTVYHSSFGGVQKLSLEEFEKSHIIVHRLVTSLLPSAETLIKSRLEERLGSDYDYGAFFYVGVRLLFKKIGILLPRVNLWQSTGLYLCTEFVSDALLSGEDSLITPFKLYEELKNDKQYTSPGIN